MSKEQTSDLFQKAKDQVAKKYGHDSWDSLLELSPSWEYYEVAKLYASLQNAELQRENESLRKQLHEHNGICQEKLSEQLNSVLPEIKLLKEQNAELQIKQRVLLDVLQEAALQIDYLHRKFKPTGSGKNVISRIESLIEKYTDKN